MGQNETAYKGRVDGFVRRLSKLATLPVWMTALGMGAKGGIPDKWYQLGAVPFYFEHKRKGKKARALQQERIDTLIELNQIAFCLAAQPDSLGATGEERLAIIRELLSWLEPDDVLKRGRRYVRDCNTLRITLEAELKRSETPF